MYIRFIKKSFYFSFLLTAFLFLSIGVVWVYNFNAIDNYLDSERENANHNISRMNKQINEISDLLFENVINREKVINIFKDAYKSDEKTKDIIRKKLYKALKKDYLVLKKYKVEQFHFHLPNLDSFLRFHRPDEYGDNLKDIRSSVEYVQKHKKPTSGFEEGVNSNAYRYVYPLFFNEEYIGSVEISYSTNSFKSIYEHRLEHGVDFIMRRDVVESKTHTNRKKNYFPYPLNSDFLIQGNINVSDHNLELIEYLKSNENVVAEMALMKEFSTYVFHEEENNYYVISFIPIENIHTNKKVAYSVMYDKSNFLNTIFFNFKMQIIISVLVSFLLAYITYREISSKRKTKKLLTQVREFYRKNSVIVNSSNNMILIVKDNEISDVNKKFLDFYKKDDLESLGSIRDNIENIFLREDGCFSVNSSSKKEFWIDEILKLKSDDRLVCIVDENINKRFFNLHISNMDNQHNEFLVIFNEVTKERQKHKILEKQAYYDNLTQVHNRHFFMKKFPAIFKDCKNEVSEFSLIMLDIDHFKNVNDIYGHDIGDKALIFLAEIVKNSIRESDIFARWGGEEFLLVVNSSLGGASKLCENLRANIEKSTKESEKIPAFTCSFGVVLINEYENINDVLKAVDSKLYKSKDSGRNIVTS